MQAEFANTAADRFGISHMTPGETPQPVINSNSSLSVPKAIQPVPKDCRLNDRDLISSIHNLNLTGKCLS